MNFQNFCATGKHMKFATKPIRQYSSHLRHVATLPWKIKKSNFSRYLADMDENTNKLHFKFNEFNSSLRVTVNTECIYVLADYLKHQAFKGIVIFFGKMWVALRRAGCCVVAFCGYVNCACVPKLFQQLINTCLLYTSPSPRD